MPILLATIAMPPGLLAINDKLEVAPIRRKGRAVRHEIRLTSSARAAMDEAVLQVRQEVAKAGWRTLHAPCCAMVTTYWPGDVPGDVDATCKATLDALQHGLAVANDNLINPAILFRHGDAGRHSRIEIALCSDLAELRGILGW